MPELAPSTYPGALEPRGSCIQKPLAFAAVTTPVTHAPLSGEICAAPWICAMVVSWATAQVSVVSQLAGAGTPEAKSAALSSVSAKLALRESEAMLLPA